MELIRLIQFVLRHPLNRRAPLKALSRLLRWQIGSRLLPEAFFVTPYVNTARLLMTRGMTGATGNWYCGLDEVGDMGFVLHALRPGERFVDIGANIGSYTILAAAGSGANVIAVEPISQTFARLIANIKVNNLEHQIEAHCVGLSNRIGRLSFTTAQDTVNHVLADGENGASDEIEVTTMDSLLQGRQPTIIKIDVEGYELAVLEGAEKTLSSPSVLAVVMELNGSGARYGASDQQCIDRMERHGFKRWSYCATKRVLSPVTSITDKSGNTIFLRNHREIERRLHSAQKTRLINGWI